MIINLNRERRRRRPNIRPRRRAFDELEAAQNVVDRLAEEADRVLFLDAEHVGDVLVHLGDLIREAREEQARLTGTKEITQ